MEVSNLSDAEFKALVKSMLKELRGGPHQHKKDPVRNKEHSNRNE